VVIFTKYWAIFTSIGLYLQSVVVIFTKRCGYIYKALWLYLQSIGLYLQSIVGVFANHSVIIAQQS
jgi:hypothetical protein